jgi:hypothetical protein
VLARAAAPNEPRLDRLVAAVPAMMAESYRRRRLARTPAARISLAAGAWLPRMAAAAALLVAIALLWPSRAGRETVATTADSQTALDSWVVTGSSPVGVQDPVMDALVR